MATMSVSEARASLSEILDRALAGEEVTITRHGSAVAVVVRPDVIRVRRIADAPSLTVTRAEELVADIAANRSAR